jgi:hypothetical protein
MGYSFSSAVHGFVVLEVVPICKMEPDFDGSDTLLYHILHENETRNHIGTCGGESEGDCGMQPVYGLFRAGETAIRAG